ncbi:MAG: hypothetical protein HKP62_07850 [Sulfurovum sp.]|nr:hypothetical protein [Sulfurovum sp.]NNJ45915.1 hypothetical protein [Sulfurovum sp.]
MKNLKKILESILFIAVSVSGLFAAGNASVASTAKKSTIVYTIKGNAEERYYTMMDKPVKALGYRLPDPRKHVNQVYKEQYGSTTLEVLSFMTIVNDKKVKPLLEIDPKLAGFNPFNLVIYKHEGKDETVISHLTASAIIDMLGITDQKVITEYTKQMEELDALVAKTFPSAVVSHGTYEGAVENTMMHYEITFDRPEDLDDYIDEIQEKVDDTFTEKGYIMAGFFDYKQGKPDLLPSYDAFWTFSLCHFPYSYSVFDNEGAMPEAAVFAPCTMYMYIKKDTNTLVIGMPRLANWNRFFTMNNQKRADFLNKLDKDIPATFIEIGAKEIK